MASITLSWAAGPLTDNIIAYDIYGANGTGVAFGSCALLASVNATSWTEAGIANGQARTYYIKARNAAGSSAAEGPLNITAQAATYVVGPASATDSDFAQFDGTTGKLIKDGGLARDTDVTLAANSDSKIPSQKAVKGYVDAKLAGLSWKQAVRAATTANGTLATAFENGDTIDGVTLATGDRILIKNQSTGAENGIYTVNASGAPTRATDADSGAEMVNASCYVSEGTANADTQWTCTTNAPITIGSTALAFAQLTSGGGTGDVAGPSSATNLDFVQFDGTTGKLIKDGGLALDTDGTLAANSDSKIPSQKAVKTYVAAHGGHLTTGSGVPTSTGTAAGEAYSRTDAAGVYVSTPSATGAAPAKVQTKSGTANTGTGALTLNAAPTPGNLLLGWISGSTDPYSLIDTSKWTVITHGGSGAGYLVAVRRYVEAGDTAVLPPIMSSSGSFMAFEVIEVSGVSGDWAADFEQFDSKYDQTGSATLATNTITTVAQYALSLIGAFNYNANGSNITGASGYAFDEQGNNFTNYGAWALVRASYSSAASNASTTFNIPNTVNRSGYIAIVLRSSPQWTLIGPPATVYRDDGLIASNISGVKAPYSANGLSAIIDHILGSTRGSVIRRGASGWEILTPGTNGYVLTSNGAGADPVWAAAPGGGGAGTPPTIVQSAISVANSASITLGAAPTNGNLLVCIWGNPTTASLGSGWTNQQQNSSGTDWFTVCTKVAGAGESATQTPIGSTPSAAIICMWEIAGAAASPVLVASAGGPVTTNFPQSAQFPGLSNVLNLGAVDIMGTGATVTSLMNMTQDQIANSGNRRGVMGHSDGSKPLAQTIAQLSASVSCKAGLICLTA
jgi:hypothetical protein